MVFQYPQAYRPNAEGISISDGCLEELTESFLGTNSSTFSFSAKAPLFDPCWSTAGDACRVKVNVKPSSEMRNGFELWDNKRHKISANEFEPYTPEIKASKDTYELTSRAMRDRKTGENKGAEYFQRDKDGRINTKIECTVQSGTELQCKHKLLRDGWAYEFNHQQSELIQWRAMQQRLVDLTNSFRTDKARDVHVR